MNWTWIALLSLLCAGLPAALFLVNLGVYRSARRRGLRKVLTREGLDRVSVLIPARNEERNIRAAVEAALDSREVDFEVIVLDDHSTDRTAGIVAELARQNLRVRLATAPPLPHGWCGKQHACHHLSQLARHPLLVFIDADVRLAPDGLARLTEFMDQNGADLASGVPRQELGTLSERLLLPLIHFILLGFLPLPAMRRSNRVAFGAGCGQLFVARRAAYQSSGGHAAIRQSLHDGIQLPRAFRRAGFRTDLFDATDLASCRMYRTNAEVWRGLGKNAVEGLAAPRTIVPATILLLLGQVLPVVLVSLGSRLTPSAFWIAVAAAFMAYLPRLVSVVRFRQPVLSALLHPVGVAALLGIQWFARARAWAGHSSTWKGRAYGGGSAELRSRADNQATGFNPAVRSLPTNASHRERAPSPSISPTTAAR